MKFVHASDLHLDSPLLGLERYEGAPVEQIRSATRRAMKNLVDLCIDEGAELLLIAGDLYDGEWRDYSTGLFFASQMSLLRQAGVRVVWLRGNHDAESRLTKHLCLPECVFELGVRRPETLVFEDLGIAVHGQGFAQAATTDDLATRYPALRRGLLNVGLLHTALEGREGHAPYAPCRLEALVNKGYDYWALGHVHQREVLHRDPWVVFSGNLQGRHARETGPKGATLVTVDHGRITQVEHRPLDEVRWNVCQVSLQNARNLDDVLEGVRRSLKEAEEEAGGRLVLGRVRLSGATSVHHDLEREREQILQQVRSLSLDVGGAGVWVEKLVIDTESAARQSLQLSADDPLGTLAERAREIRQSTVELTALRAEFRDLLNKLPADNLAPRLVTEQGLEELLREAEELVSSRLAEPEERMG